MTDEEYVRSVWLDVDIEWNLIEGKWYGMAHSNGRGIPLHGFETEEEIWSAAAAFTSERLEAIQLLEEEIDVLTEYKDLIVPEAGVVLTRVLVLRQAALKEFKQGMKE